MATADGLRRAVRARAEQRFTSAVAAMVEAVRADAPRDSGTLESSIGEAGRSAAGARLSTLLVAPVEYASWQDEGTGIYGPKGTPIVAKGGGVLAWEGTGRARTGRRAAGAAQTASGMVFARSVRGSPATKFWSSNVTPEGWREALSVAGR